MSMHTRRTIGVITASLALVAASAQAQGKSHGKGNGHDKSKVERSDDRDRNEDRDDDRKGVRVRGRDQGRVEDRDRDEDRDRVEDRDRDEDRKRIFEEFLQLGNPGRTSKKGLGLGLSIVQRLCALLGYKIRLTSEYGKGSAFSFEVPVGQIRGLREDAASTAAHAPADLTGKLIVVIDDESAIVEGMQVLLSGWGAEVIGSTTGDDVVAAVHAAGKLPALLIVDHRLGIGETGIEVAQRIRRELDPEIPGILVTGSITPDLDALARAANLEFLLKPVVAEELRKRIAAALG